MRYNVFQCVYDLVELRRQMSFRPLSEWDGDLGETFLVLNDMVTEDPEQLVGVVLFDAEEAAAIRAFMATPVDGEALYAPWEEQERYLYSEEWRKVLDAAAALLNVMLDEGRGLPGWAHGGLPGWDHGRLPGSGP
jgi:hypothetical protein